jgi:hypothetical protein
MQISPAVCDSVRDLTAVPAVRGLFPCCTAQESEHARGDRGFALLRRTAQDFSILSPERRRAAVLLAAGAAAVLWVALLLAGVATVD